MLRKKPQSKNNSIHPTAGQEIVGLTSAEAARRLQQYGENVIAKKKRMRPVVAFLKKFQSPLILLLIAASIVSIFLGQNTDAIIILIMVSMSAILDFVNTRRSEKATQSLISKVAVTATVVRDSREQELKINEIVPGDMVQLTAGDIIPADCVVLTAKDLFINQSALTGESFPVEKEPATNAIDATLTDTERRDLVFMGSSVVTGYATVRVDKTGASTKYGAIAERLAANPEETDFEKGIKKFSYLIMQVTFVLVVLVFGINAFVHRGIFESFIFALAIAIGLTPELLPMIIALALSHGSMKMSKKNVIVKNLSSIQNLGSMDILCTDKTGTLTENKITLVRHVDWSGHDSDEVLYFTYLNSIFHTGVKNPLDGAIREFTHLDVTGYKKYDELPFDFQRRRESIVVEKENKRTMITKGAPEFVLPICKTYRSGGRDLPFDGLNREAAQHEYDALSRDGFRVLGVSYKPAKLQTGPYANPDERDMNFLGFVAFYDPPKQSVTEAISELASLGVEIKILTGDSELLTEKVCRDIGLPVRGVTTGNELLHMNDDELIHLASRTTIFARIAPAQKERIILILKKAKHSVGYLGDGINDAPALRAADVGISVNNAVDVAKDTADIILLHKSMRVLRDGVIEGRKTFQNTMKYILMGLSSNFGNMFSMAGLSAILPFFPMLPSQVLLNNLMYDSSQFTISTDKVDQRDIRKPLKWDISFIRKYMFVFGPISSIFDFATIGALYYLFHPAVHQFQAAWFMESLATQTFVIYVIRTRKIPFIQSSPSRILLATTLGSVILGWILPYIFLNKYLKFEPLSWGMLAAITGLVVIYLVCVQGVKVWFYRHLEKKAAQAR
ncbi:MAG: magnesium-translocating P-type ATPase [Patescibacteria group bacterium]